jgi:hypothetical protein
METTVEIDGAILRAALLGLETRLAQLRAERDAVALQLLSGPVVRRRLSAAARQSISDAQKKRWAEYRQQNGGNLRSRNAMP